MKSFYQRKITTSIKPFFGRPDLVPMLDVFFLLLMFMMIASPFVQVSGLEVDLPRVNTGAGQVGLERFVITVLTPPGGQSQIYFNDKPVTMADLPEELAGVSRQTGMNTVILRADSTTEYQVTAEIMAIAARFNLATFLATQSPPDKKTQAEDFAQ